MQNFRRTLGPRFSEGARLFWVALEERCLTIAAAAALLDMPRGNVSRLLYGDQKAGIDVLARIENVFGVPTSTWALEPTEPFVVPALREEQEGAA